MKTQVILKRKLFDGEISQQSKTGFYRLNDLFEVGNKWRVMHDMPMIRMNDWIVSKPVAEFISELSNQFGEVKKASRGRNASTWVHPFIFIDAALYIDPKFKIQVYGWLYDELLKYRNSSGDSYKLMCGALYDNSKRKGSFHKDVSKLAVVIQNACKVKDWNSATEDQLKTRDKIHNNIALLADVLRDNRRAVEVGIFKALEE